MLVAIHEFQQRQTPRWQYLAPVALTLLMSAMLPEDIRGRLIWGGLIYGFQMVLIARALLSDRMTRAGQAWRLLFGGIVMVILVLGLRGPFALSGHADFAQPQNTAALQPIQLVTYIAAMSTALLGSIGFVLMVKERTDREVMHAGDDRQPHPDPQPARAEGLCRTRAGQAQRFAAGVADDRRGPLQGHQRYPRPPDRGRGIVQGSPRCLRDGCADMTCWGATAAKNSA